MWPVYCSDCQKPTLVDCRRLTRVVNLARGVIAVEVRCPLEHRIPVLTGCAVLDGTRRDDSGQAPAWTRPS